MLKQAPVVKLALMCNTHLRNVKGGMGNRGGGESNLKYIGYQEGETLPGFVSFLSCSLPVV